MIDTLKNKLNEWTERRNEFVQNANLEITAYNGRIAQLEDLINEFSDKKSTADIDAVSDTDARAANDGDRLHRSGTAA